MDTLGLIFFYLLIVGSFAGVFIPIVGYLDDEFSPKPLLLSLLIILGWFGAGGAYAYTQLLANKPVSPSLELIIPGLGHGPVELDPHGVGRVMIPPQALGIPDATQEAPQGYQESPKSNGLDKNGHVEGIVRL